MSVLNPIRELIEKAPKLCSTDAQMVLREAYETTYGIYNHNDKTAPRPLALVAMHPSENATVGSTLYERIDQFVELAVIKHFGLSLIEFFELPTDIAKRVLEIAQVRQEAEKRVADGVANQLEGR